MMTDTSGAVVLDPFHVWIGLDVCEKSIPFSLRAIDQWVVWKAVPRKNGQGTDKIPHQTNGVAASSTDPATWCDFQTAFLTYDEEGSEYAGVGITVTKENGLVYLDFDHVRDAHTGVIDADVLSTISFLDAYAEVSPSGTGIRVIGYGSMDRAQFSTKRLQCWSASHFMTITGHRVEGTPGEITTFDAERLKGVFDWYTSQDPNATPQKITTEAAAGADIHDGSRNRALTALAGAMRRHGIGREGIEAALLAENAGRCKPPLTPGEVRRIAKSVARYVPEGDIALGAAVAAELLNSKSAYQHKSSEHGELPAFLVDEAPGMIGEIVRYGLETAHKPLPHITLQAAFAAVSAAASRRYRTNHNNWPSLWFLNTEVTASGKEHPESLIELTLEAAGLGSLLAGSGYTSPGAIFSVLLDRPAHIVLIDEFGKIMQSAQAKGNQQKADAITLLMQAFSSCHRVLRPLAYSAMGLSKEQRMEMADRRVCNPGVVIYASTTPGTFFGSIDRQWISDGFLGRFLVCPSAIGRQLSRSVQHTPTPATVAEWLAEVACRPAQIDAKHLPEGGLDTTADQEPAPIAMRFSSPAERLLSAFESDIHKRMDEAQRWGLDPLYGRTREKAMRLSMLVCLADGAANRVIGENHVDYAVSYAIGMDSMLVEAAKLSISDGEFARVKGLCLEHIRKAGERGMTERDLERACAPFNAMKPVDQKTILGALQKSLLVDLREIQSKTGRGRKRQAWLALEEDGDESE